jgi:CBS domain containing-hemolysin-like protein
MFSGSETALTTINESRLHKLIQARVIGGKMLAIWRDRPGLVLSSILLGNNLVNILASSLATSFAITLLASAGVDEAVGFGVGLSVGVMTFFILVFGEVLPKTYAKHNPEVVLVLLPFLLLWYWIGFPLAAGLSWLTRTLVRLGGGQLEQKGHTVTEEEIEYLIQRSTEQGGMDAEKEQMLSGVFALEETVAREIMVPRTEVVAFEVDTTMEEVLAAMEGKQLSRYPVFEGTVDNIVGVFYAKDFISYLTRECPGGKPFNLRNFLRPAYMVPGTKKLNELLHDFRKEKVHIAVVLDEYGGTAGVVALEDVIEEMVGDIWDEYDNQENLFQIQPDGAWIVWAKMSVEDLSDELGVSFPEDREFDTVGGLLMDLAGSVPVKGATLDWHFDPSPGAAYLRFTVLDGNNVRVRKALMRLISVNEEEKP